MKNIKLLGLIGLGCGALLLTGCGGGGHSLTCSATEDDGSVTKITFNYDSEEKELQSVDVSSEIDIPDTATDDDVAAAKENGKARCAYYPNATKCEVSQSGKTLKFYIEGLKAEDLNYTGNDSLEKVKQDMENDGYTCK